MALAQTILAFPALVLVLLIGKALYNVFLHPLRSYPGPKLWAASRLPLIRRNTKGDLHVQVQRLHEQYGDVVRIGPDELSYITSTAWKTIYGHRPVEMPKSLKGHGNFSPDNGVHGILTTPLKPDHSRMRRQIAQAFSDRALRSQEAFVHKYVDDLIALLDKSAGTGRAINITDYYNFITFDVIGDLAFGESFDCLRDTRLHSWITFIFDMISTIPYLQALQYFGVSQYISMVVPKKLLESRKGRIDMAMAKLKRRLEKGVNGERGDFLSYVLSQPEGKGMSLGELQTLSQVLVVGGSETTATTLSAATFYLMTNRRVYEKLLAEIRGAFAEEKDITLVGAGRLKYLSAVVEEALRMFPPVPASLPRLVPKGGEMIDGEFVPAGFAVGVSQYAAYHSATNFVDPFSFVPERFAPETEEEKQKFAADQKGALQPFSFGPRNCIGRNLAYAEMKIIMSRVLWNFDLEIAPGSDAWMGHLPANILWQKEPLMAYVKARPGRPVPKSQA